MQTEGGVFDTAKISNESLGKLFPDGIPEIKPITSFTGLPEWKVYLKNTGKPGGVTHHSLNGTEKHVHERFDFPCMKVVLGHEDSRNLYRVLPFLFDTFYDNHWSFPYYKKFDDVTVDDDYTIIEHRSGASAALLQRTPEQYDAVKTKMYCQCPMAANRFVVDLPRDHTLLESIEIGCNTPQEIKKVTLLANVKLPKGVDPQNVENAFEVCQVDGRPSIQLPPITASILPSIEPTTGPVPDGVVPLPRYLYDIHEIPVAWIISPTMKKVNFFHHRLALTIDKDITWSVAVDFGDVNIPNPNRTVAITTLTTRTAISESLKQHARVL